MKTCATMVYDLGPDDTPLVVVLRDGSAALHYQAWSKMPTGFSIRFVREQLPILRELCQALEVQNGNSIEETTDDATHEVGLS